MPPVMFTTVTTALGAMLVILTVMRLVNGERLESALELRNPERVLIGQRHFTVASHPKARSVKADRSDS